MAFNNPHYNKYQSSGICIWDDYRLGFGKGTYETKGETGSPDIDLYWDGTNSIFYIKGTNSNTKVSFSNTIVAGVDFPLVFTFQSGIATNTLVEAKFKAPFPMTISEVSYHASGTVTTSGSTLPGIQVLEGSTSILSTSDPFQLSTTPQTTSVPTAKQGIADDAAVTVRVTSNGNSTAKVVANGSTSPVITVMLTAVRALS